MQSFKINVSFFPFVFGGLFFFVSILFMAVAIIMGYFTVKTKMNADTYTIASGIKLNSYWSPNSNGLGGTMMYSPEFLYNINNKEYSCLSGVSSSIKPRLDNNKVFYSSKNPELCISEYDFNQSIIFARLLLIAGLVPLIIGLSLLVKVIIAIIKYKRLAQIGQLIKDIPCRIIPSHIKFNGMRGYVVEIDYRGLKFKSETKFDIDARRKTADLLIDPLNPKNYFIGFDISKI